MAEILYLGIDVSMAENTYCLLLHHDTEARCPPAYAGANNLPGAEQLVGNVLLNLDSRIKDLTGG